MAQSMRLETITPARAEKLLTHNSQNRNPSNSLVVQYAREMEQGEWDQGNGEAIKIDTEGDLMDGQQRLMACVLSGIPLITYVVRGLPPEYKKALDQGRKRTAGDILKIEGFLNTNRLAAIVRMVRLWDEGMRNINGFRGNVSLTPKEIIELLENDRDDVYINATKMTQNNELLLLAPPRVLGALAVLALRTDAELADQFFAQLQSGIDLHSGDPVLTLARYWRNLKRHGKRTSTGLYLGAGVRAWNAFIEGRKLSQISYRSSEIPEISTGDASITADSESEAS